MGHHRSVETVSGKIDPTVSSRHSRHRPYASSMARVDRSGDRDDGSPASADRLRATLAAVDVRTGTPEIIRITAEAAGCSVVLEERGGASLTATPSPGRVVAGRAGGPVTRVAVGGGRTVRFDRPGGSAPGDVELAGVLAAFLAEHGRDGREVVDDDGPRELADDRDQERATLVDVVLSGTSSDSDRSRALRALGLRSERDVVVVAVSGPTAEPVSTAAALLLAGYLVGRPAITLVGGVAAALLQGRRQDTSLAQALRDRIADPRHPHRTLFAGLRVGVGRAVPALHARRSWTQARNALRFASTPDIEPVADHAELGVLVLLTRFSPAELAELPEVQAIEEFRRHPTGPKDLAVADIFCRTGSLRRAAAALHMHHSTVQLRLQRVEEAMGWDLTQPRQRLRARMTFIVFRLAEPGTGGSE
jgi:PucR-like helix-turn-helix protein/diguanylate cyclase with GGDEF domain